MVSMETGMRHETMGVDHAMSRVDRVDANIMGNSKLNSIVGSLWAQQRTDNESGSSQGNQSPRSGVMSEGEPESPGDSGTDVRHKDGEDQSDPEPEYQMKPSIGIRSDLLPTEPIPRESISEMRDMSNLHNLPALEALRRQAGGHGNFLQNHTPFQPLVRPPSQPPTPQSSNGSVDMGPSWSFEEQFKQLYEIDDNPKRREFLDDLFAFMQKRGTPINRLPIMAKQVLDLYELYNLVCARGGLVEVVNKKQWQEIIKGLGLPSSITSAAFTLRTQYTKYLYPLECSQKNFSSAEELQVSIDGNKREGRRGSYGNFEPPMSHGFPSSQVSPLSLVQSAPRQVAPHSPPQKQSPGAPDPIAALEMTRMALWKLYQQGGQNQLPPFMQNLPLDFLQKQNLDLLQKQNLPLDILPPLQASPRPPSQEAAINLHVAEQRRKDERQIREEDDLRRRDEQAKERLAVMDREHKEKLDQQREGREKELRERLMEREDERPSKKLRMEGTPRQANISMSSSEDEQGDKSMAISMEINGVTYSGVLYARPS